MRQFEGRSLTIAATLMLVAGGISVAIYLLGQFAISRVMAQDALSTAELWTRSLVRDGSDIVTALAGTPGDALDSTLAIANIDAVVVVPSANAPLELRGAGLLADLQAAIDVQTPGATLRSAPADVYTRDVADWFGRSPYHSWVLLPAAASSGARLAIRVDQTETAVEIIGSFGREVLFSGGVAIITFFAFMLGFSYRQRQLSAENDAIRYLALHDELTELPNRKQFEDVIQATLEKVAASDHKAALFMLDLDGFKAVNDTLGHPVGDGLLKACGARLKASLRNGDLLARLSGDEFAIIVPKVTDPTVLAPLAERVLALVAKPFRVDGHEILIGCSIGLAVAPENGTDATTLMRNADFALYKAKSEGRRTWRFFDPKMAEDLASRRTLEDGLRHALENEHFELAYQPQVELSTGRTTGYEAMLRWRLPGKGLIPAGVFVAIAEETGLVIPIGEWVIRQVARDSLLLPADCTIAINLSATQLKRDGIETFIEETIKSHRIAKGRIEVEVNEAILGRHEEMAFARLEKIRAAGVGIVMDSFGVGTLSLALLSRYGFDKVKVDRSFLLNDQVKGGAVLAAICGLGRSLDFRVSGQGVETVEHMTLLRAAGASEAQGYYFAPPMPIEQILARAEEEAAPLVLAQTA